MLRLKLLGSAAAAAILLSGCAIYTPTLSSAAALDQQSAYLYGRFTLDKMDKTTLGRLRSGLMIASTGNGKSYTIEFEPDGNPVAIAVAPGAYSMKKLTFATWDYERQGEKALPSGPLTVPFEVQAGKAYYLGDFVVVAGSTADMGAVWFKWRLSSVSNNYAATTDDVAKVLPQLESMDKVAVIPE